MTIGGNVFGSFLEEGFLYVKMNMFFSKLSMMILVFHIL